MNLKSTKKLSAVVERIEAAFGIEVSIRVQRACNNQGTYEYLPELLYMRSVKHIVATAFDWSKSEEGYSYWRNLAGYSWRQ